MRFRYEFLFVIVFLSLLITQALPFGQTVSSGFETFQSHEQLISSVTWIRLKLGDRVFHDVLVGPNNWLVYATDRGLDKYQNVQPLTEVELKDYENSLINFETLVKENGGLLLFVAAPYKNTIYPEYIPTEISQIGKTSRPRSDISLARTTPIASCTRPAPHTATGKTIWSKLLFDRHALE